MKGKHVFFTCLNLYNMLKCHVNRREGLIMKRLVAVLSGLLVLPAFAEIAPIVYDEIGEGFGEEIIVDDAAVAEESTTEEVVVPVVQSAKVNPRNATASSRAASRAVPSGAAANSRSVSARNTSSSRNATQARTGTATASRTNETATRVASRPSRNAATATKSGVASRSAATNKVVSARAGSLTQTDTVNTPLYTGRVSVRSSSAMQARSPSAAGVSVAQEVSTVSTDISDLDELAQMTDYCKAQYMSCMDNFCNVLDDNQGRCSCSKNLKSYEKTETALKKATESLQDVAQQIQYIGLSKDQVETLFSQTEAELQMQNKKDTTQLKNDLDKIKDMIIGVKTGNATSSETGLSLDFSGLLMGFNIDSTGFDLTTLFSGTTNTSSISNQRGEQLYKTATARCKTAVLNTCQAQGVDISVITNSYDLEIDKQCIVYERSLNEANDNMSNTVRNAKAVLQKARLMVAQQKNSYDLRGCINALDSCMQDEFVCGADYENCLDPTGKYIVNGEIVNGSTPGKANDIADNSKANGLYSVWNYGSSTDNAWQSNHNLSEYVSSTMFKKVGDFTTNGKNYGMSEYLQGKIGYHDDSTGKNVGMCISVLNQCQDYTYNKEGKYITNNQVISEYLQRTLVQIKAAQDEMLATHAEDCLNDVASCLQQNNSSSYYYNSTDSYEDITDVAINACKSQIKTCMSAMGETVPTGTNAVLQLKTWLEGALTAKTSPIRTLGVYLHHQGVEYQLGTVLCSTENETVVGVTDEHAVKICEIFEGGNDCKSVNASSYMFGSTNYLMVDGDGTSDPQQFPTESPSYNTAVVNTGKNKLIITVDQCKDNKKLYFGA
jgi:hypothetical protein